MYYRLPAKLTALLAGLICVAGSGLQAFQQDSLPPAQVLVATAETRLMAPQMNVSGTVISLNDSRIAAEVEGLLLYAAKVGTAVKKGDVLARIDSRLLEIAVRRAQANLASLKADMVFRQSDVARFEELAEKNNASQARLQEVISRRATLEQNILNAAALLDLAEGDFARATIRAPFPGHVAERIASIGEYISVGADVVRLVDTGHIEISMAAPISIVPYLISGNRVNVSGGQNQLQLPIRTIVPVGDSVSRMVEVRLSLEAESWVVGAPVKVLLPKGQPRTVIAVPRDAIVLKSGNAYIFKVDADGIAKRIDIDPRDVEGLWVSIGAGVVPGDRIVVRGGERLSPRQAVIIQNK